jgi:hypothetical protein
MEKTFLEILQESELPHVPPTVRHFLFREDAPPSSPQSWEFFSFGYGRAFEVMMEVALERWPEGDYLRMPLFFLCRHSLELRLKSAIREYADQSTPAVEMLGHGLVGLWKNLLTQIDRAGFPTDDDWTGYCGKLVDHVDQADPGGEHFRYPSNRVDDPLEYTRVELIGLAKAHFHITCYCDASVSMLLDGTRW